MDRATKGRKYISKTEINKCRPARVTRIPTDDKKKCFEVDTKTLGDHFAKRINILSCFRGSPYWVTNSKNNIDGKCYIQHILIKKRFCRPQKINYSFISESYLIGRCFAMSMIHEVLYTIQKKLKLINANLLT